MQKRKTGLFTFHCHFQLMEIKVFWNLWCSTSIRLLKATETNLVRVNVELWVKANYSGTWKEFLCDGGSSQHMPAFKHCCPQASLLQIGCLHTQREGAE